jgi:predicted RNA-binding protein with PIN domain
VHWLIDGYNVIRRSPELGFRERESLDAGRRALCELLGSVARTQGDRFTVVFDGAGGGGSGGRDGVAIVFSSARENADRVLARMATRGGAVVSNDREVRRAANRAGAIAISADAFLARIEALRGGLGLSATEPVHPDADELEGPSGRPKKGNPYRLSKKARATARALGRLGGSARR